MTFINKELGIPVIHKSFLHRAETESKKRDACETLTPSWIRTSSLWRLSAIAYPRRFGDQGQVLRNIQITYQISQKVPKQNIKSMQKKEKKKANPL
jgi:hypothetical protein